MTERGSHLDLISSPWQNKRNISNLQQQLKQQTEDAKQWKQKQSEAEGYARRLERDKEELNRKVDLLQLDKVASRRGVQLHRRCRTTWRRK